jgi:hypothetical protein
MDRASGKDHHNAANVTANGALSRRRAKVIHSALLPVWDIGPRYGKVATQGGATDT